MGLSQSQPLAPPEVVLVPPLFERDHKARSRMAKSSYDYLFAKPALKWLFNDFLWLGEARGIVYMQPAEDRRLSVKARFGSGLPRYGREGAGPLGGLTFRFQPSTQEALTFVDVKASATEAGRAQVRACYVDSDSGFGVFGVLPLTSLRGGAAASAAAAQLGLRFSNPDLTFGVIANPANQALDKIWLAARRGPFTAGVQWRASSVLRRLEAGLPLRGASKELGALANRLSYAVAYSPITGSTTGRNSFTAALEVVEARTMVASFLYHMAVSRLVRNPFENQDVVGITNYIDIGVQVVSDLVTEADPLYGKASAGALAGRADAQVPSLRLAGAWQVNKNFLVKGRVGSEGAAAALAVRAWWQPSMLLALCAGVDAGWRPRLGISLLLENYGNIRYERPASSMPRRGRALVQHHVALPEDIANKEGTGLLVAESEFKNKETLGQAEPRSAAFL